MLEPAQLLTNLLDKMLEILVGLKKVTSEMAMKAKQEYSKFLTHVVKRNTKSFNEFEKSKNRLDYSYKSIWSIVKIILVLSHGQATVERGFN